MLFGQPPGRITWSLLRVGLICDLGWTQDSCFCTGRLASTEARIIWLLYRSRAVYFESPESCFFLRSGSELKNATDTQVIYSTFVPDPADGRTSYERRRKRKAHL